MHSPQWVAKLEVSGPQASELLEAERARSTISVGALSRFLYTQERIEAQDRILAILRKEPVFDKSQDYFNGRIDAFKGALTRAKRLRQLRVKHGWTREENIIAMELIGEVGPYHLHFSMFTMTLRDHGTPEQHRLFLDLAESYKIIGCYAQSELGHASNVRGLETTATWNPKDKTFVLHSPYLTASKWWIGGLGRTANHTVLMAQLYIQGTSYGPHLFVVPIRDLETHQPLPGVHVGDIGPKFGLNTTDNGFLLLDHVQIPHVNMLAKFARIDPDTSQYIKRAPSSIFYSTVTYSRCTVVFEAGRTLARAATIAVRYTAGRCQFTHRDAPPNSPEIPVINYTSVQSRIFPVLSWCFALHFIGRHIMLLHANTKATAGTASSAVALSELHALSCGLKALASTVTAEGIETSRRALGGHGFSSFSGLVSWYNDYLPTVTWEGDNHLLTQQVARYVLKCAQSVLQGNPLPNDTTTMLASYVQSQHQRRTLDILTQDDDIVKAFAWRTAFLTLKILKRQNEDKASWNSLLIDFGRLSIAHSQYLVVKAFYDTLQQPALKAEVGPETVEVLRKLYRLLAWDVIDKAATEFLQSDALKLDQIDSIRGASLEALLGQIRPHAVRLVDAWNLPDWQLNSSLGQKNGKVYEDLFYRASQLNPLNAVTVDPNPDSGVVFKAVEESKSLAKL